MTEKDLKETVLTNVTHVQQRFDWDCGIACVLMVLSSDQRNDFLEDFDKICAEEGFKTSVWTIDLAYLLRRFHVPCLYYTITLGVDSGYLNEDYYSKVLAVDTNRICQRFQSAASDGVNVEKRHVDLKEILAHLAAEKLCIVLVNSNILYCKECKGCVCEAASCNLFSPNCFMPSSSYNGHYVLLCGYDLTKGAILYRSPSYNDRICSVTFKDFENARASYGTDEDIIFID